VRGAEERLAELAARQARLEAAEAAAASQAQAQAEARQQLDAIKLDLAQRSADLEAADAEVIIVSDFLSASSPIITHVLVDSSCTKNAARQVKLVAGG
jgi:multidrug efflux pump subunit AcrA (membrane-fusion protein)